MKEITKEEFENALEIIERFKHQVNPTKMVSVTYNATVDVTVNVPIDWTIEKIKEELEDGGYRGLDREEPAKTKVMNIIELIVAGEEIDLVSSINQEIEILEFDNETCGKVVKITYTGDGDPVYQLADAIKKYTIGKNYKEFVDMNMDNPWVRIIEIK